MGVCAAEKDLKHWVPLLIASVISTERVRGCLWFERVYRKFN